MDLYQKDKTRFIELFSKFTGVPRLKLREYLNNFSMDNIFTHPTHLTTDLKQLEKIKQLNEMNNIYSNLAELKADYYIRGLEDISIYFKNKFNNVADREYLAVAFLDTKHKIMESKIIYEGTIDECIISPREILKEALLLDSKSIVMAHNHPSGDPLPSYNDIEVTKRMILASEPLGVDMLDHVIIGKKDAYSMRLNNIKLFKDTIRSLVSENNSWDMEI